jgi:hypothetical protein
VNFHRKSGSSIQSASLMLFPSFFAAADAVLRSGRVALAFFAPKAAAPSPLCTPTASSLAKTWTALKCVSLPF